MSDTQSMIQISVPMIMCYQNREKERNERYKEQTQRNARNDKVEKKNVSKRIQKHELVAWNLGQQWDTYTCNC